MSQHLHRGDRLPRIVTEIPGPRSLELAASLAAFEAPAVNSLYCGEPGIVWREALGANVLDVDGNRFIDLTAGFGVAAVGHRHPKIVAAMVEQAERLLHGLGDVAAHPARIELARRLVEIAPVDDACCYFAVSGSDAVEIALKTAGLATGRSKVLAFDPGYHGTTLGSLSVTSRPAFRQPFGGRLDPGVVRLPFGCSLDRVDSRLADREVAAVVVEPIVGREGVLIPPDGWLSGLADRCRQHGTLFVADEIFTGFGRTGDLFAVDSAGVRPDLLCCGKALAGGMPLAVTLGRRELMAAWDRGGEALHTATFLAHPPACAAALASLDLILNERLSERSSIVGSSIGSRLRQWPERFAQLSAVRGKGLLWGLELVDAAVGAQFAHACRQHGLIILVGGPDSCIAQIVPPLTIAPRQLDDALDRIEAVFSQDLDG